MPIGTPASGLSVSPAARARIGGVGGGERMVGRLDEEGVERLGRGDRGDERLGRPRARRSRRRGRRRGARATPRSVRSVIIRSPWARRRSRARPAAHWRAPRRGSPPSDRPRRRAGAAWLGITAVIGSTPLVSTSPSCSIQPRMLLSSGTSASASASLIAMRARLAILRTVAVSTDMARRLASRRRAQPRCRTAATLPHGVALRPRTSHCSHRSAAWPASSSTSSPG